MCGHHTDASFAALVLLAGQHKGKKLTKEQLLKQAEAKQAEMAEAKASDEGKVHT